MDTFLAQDDDVQSVDDAENQWIEIGLCLLDIRQ